MIKEEVRQLKKCCKKIAYSTSLCFETNTLWYISYPEPCYSRTNFYTTLMCFGNSTSGCQTQQTPRIVKGKSP